MKKTIKTLAASLGVLVLAAALGFILLYGVQLLPSSAMTEHLEASERAVKGESRTAVKWSYSELATFTDQLMLHISAYPGPQSALDRALMNYFIPWKNELGAQGDDTMDFAGDGAVSVADAQGDDPESRAISYGRYWHGYQLWLRPLLLITDYPGIRLINLVLQTLLTACVVALLFKRGLRAVVLPWLFMWGILLPPTLWRSMQYSSIFYTMTAAVLSLLIHDRWWIKEGRAWLLFLLDGIAVAFFDLLTYPPAALMAPLALLMWMRRDQPLKHRLFDIICLSILWAIGYAGMWGAKWIIGSALTDFDFIGKAFEQAVYRSSFTDVKGAYAPILLTWIRNLGPVALNPFTYVAIIYAVISAVRVFRGGGLSRADVIVFALIFIMPFAWYTVIRNHSHIHARYTSKSLAVSAFAALLMLQASAPESPGSKAVPKD